MARKSLKKNKKSLSKMNKNVKNVKSNKKNVKKSIKKVKNYTYKMNGSSSSASSASASSSEDMDIEEKKDAVDEESIFNDCTNKDFNLEESPNDQEGERQQLYEEYMNTASCYFKSVLPRKFNCRDCFKENGDIKHSKIALNFLDLLGYFGYKLYNFHAMHHVLSEKRPYSGRIIYPKEHVQNLDMAQNEYYSVRDNAYGENSQYGSYASPMFYPMVYSLLLPYIEENELKVYQERTDQSHRYMPYSDLLIVPSDEDLDKIRSGIKIGEYQKLSFDYKGYLKVKHPNDIVRLVLRDRTMTLENIIYKLGLKWHELLKIYNKHDISKEDKDQAHAIAWELYYLFVNAVPYWRGSAGAAKVFLNTCLTMFDFPMVKENDAYKRQADWVAFTSHNFNDFTTKIPSVFVSL
jgi:hypothetical protein